MKQINFLPLYGSLSFSGRHAMLCKREHLAILLIIIAGILLRFHGIGFRDFNLDEAYSFLFAKNYSFDVVLSPMSVLNSGDRHPTLHYVICWLWLRSACPLLQATGLSMEAAFRSFATLFSFFTLITAIYCGRHIAGVRGGLLTGALLAFNGMSVFLAQDARMYSMLELAGACLFASLLRCQSDTEGKWSNLLLLILSSWFLMLCHYTGIIFVFSAWSWLFIKYKFWRSQLVIGALILTGLYAYWFFGFLFQLHKEQAGATAGFKFSSGLVVPFTYFSFIVGETLVLIKERSDLFSALPWIILVFTLVTIGLLGSWRFLRTYPKENVRALEVAVWLAFIPILLMLLGSLWVHKLFMSVRYAVAALVPFVILIAVGLVTWADKRNKYLATIAILFYFFVSIATLSNMYQLKVKPTTSWKSIAAYLNELKPAAVAIYSPYMKLPLSIYYSGAPLVPLPEQVMGSWDKLIKVRPELVKHDSDIVLMLSHPKMYRSQYLQLFSISSHLRRLKTDFFDVELFLKPAANEAYITKR